MESAARQQQRRQRQRQQRRPLPRLPLLLAACIAAAAAPRRAAAMYADQAGMFDWHRQHVGEVTYASYSPAAGAGSGRGGRFHVATAQGVVAGLEAADGAIAWRRAHPPDSDALLAAAALPGGGAAPAVVAASRGGSVGGRVAVRAWDTAGGALRWETVVVGADGGSGSGSGSGSSGGGGGAALARLAAREDGAGAEEDRVAVAAAGKLLVLNSASGEEVWSLELGGAGDGVRLIDAVTTATSAVTAASYAPGAATVAAAVVSSAPSFDEGGQHELALRAPRALGPAAALAGRGLATLSADGAALCAARLEEGADRLGCAALEELLELPRRPTASEVAAARLTPASSVGGTVFLALPGAGVFLIAAAERSGGGPRLVAAFPGATAASRPFAPAGDGGGAAALVFGPPGEGGGEGGAAVAVREVDAVTGAERAKFAVPPPTAPYPVHGPAPAVRAAFPAARAGAGGAAGARPVLIVWSDHTLSLAAAGGAGDGAEVAKLAWSREEALASIHSTLFIDLPAAKGAALGAKGGAAAKGIGEPAAAAADAAAAAAAAPAQGDALKQWLRVQLLAVMVQFKLGGDAEEAELLRLRAALR